MPVSDQRVGRKRGPFQLAPRSDGRLPDRAVAQRWGAGKPPAPPAKRLPPRCNLSPPPPEDPYAQAVTADSRRTPAYGNDGEVWLKTPACQLLRAPRQQALTGRSTGSATGSGGCRTTHRPEFIPGRVISASRATTTRRAAPKMHAASRAEGRSVLRPSDVWCGYYSQREFANGRTDCPPGPIRSTVAHELGPIHTSPMPTWTRWWARGADPHHGGHARRDHYAAGWVATVRITPPPPPGLGDGLSLRHPGPERRARGATKGSGRMVGGSAYPGRDRGLLGRPTVRACDLPDRGACHGLDRRVESLGGRCISAGTVLETASPLERRGDIWVVDAFTEGSAQAARARAATGTRSMPEDEFAPT